MSNILNVKNQIFGAAEFTREELEDQIIGFSQLRETEILISCEWSIDFGTGYDILQALLKMSNANYDFSDLIHVVDLLATDVISCKLPATQRFQIDSLPQSCIYLSCLRSVLEYLGWANFYDELIKYVHDQGLEIM